MEREKGKQEARGEEMRIVQIFSEGPIFLTYAYIYRGAVDLAGLVHSLFQWGAPRTSSWSPISVETL